MLELTGKETRILDRLNQSPTIGGAEAFTLIGGDFDNVKQTLKGLEEQDLISIMGSYSNEKELFYCTIFRQLATKK
jgi:hypothetical protein